VAGANHGGTQPGIWARRLDAVGQQVWGSRLTASGADFSGALASASNGTGVNDMASDAAGNILVTGSTPTAVAPAFTDQAESDAFVSSRCFFAFGRLARGVEPLVTAARRH